MPENDPEDKIGQDVKKAQDAGFDNISSLEEINNPDGAKARIPGQAETC
jgi:hypothetical protein